MSEDEPYGLPDVHRWEDTDEPRVLTLEPPPHFHRDPGDESGQKDAPLPVEPTPPVPLDQRPETDNPASFQEMFVRIFAEAHSVMCSKQADYGPGNIAAFGEFGVLVRANDKLQRLKHLLGGQTAPAYESLEDSWLDLLNYAAIAIAVRRGWWTESGCPPLLNDLRERSREST